MMHLRQAARDIIRSKVQHETTKGEIRVCLQEAKAGEHTQVRTRGISAHEQQRPAELFLSMRNQVPGNVHAVLVTCGIRMFGREVVANRNDGQ
jgi:hypothetical protein